MEKVSVAETRKINKLISNKNESIFYVKKLVPKKDLDQKSIALYDSWSSFIIFNLLFILT